MGIKRLLVSAGFRTIRFLRDYEPEICMVVGGVSGILALFAAGKAGVKCKEIMEELDQNLKEQRETEEKAKACGYPNYTAKDGKKDRMKFWLFALCKMGKVCWKTVVLALLSFFSFFRGFGLMKARFISAIKEYTRIKKEKLTLEKALLPYVGEEGLKKIVEGEKEETEETAKDAELTPKTEKLKSVPKDKYWYMFEAGNRNWQKDPEKNRIFLWQTQQWANWHLKTHKILLLNELLVHMNFPKVQEGQTVGWRYYDDPKEAERMGVHNKVDLGVFRTDTNDEALGRFLEGIEANVIIKPNVDGPVLGLSGWAVR